MGKNIRKAEKPIFCKQMLFAVTPPYTISRSRSHRVQALVYQPISTTLTTFLCCIVSRITLLQEQESLDFKQSIHHSYQKSKSSFTEGEERRKGGLAVVLPFVFSHFKWQNCISSFGGKQMRLFLRGFLAAISTMSGLNHKNIELK